MITNDEVKNIAFRMLPKTIGSKSSQKKMNEYFKLDKYFRQEDKKDRLLKLYQNLSMETDVNERSKYWDQINEIECDIYG